jgi:hypothetical protein
MYDKIMKAEEEARLEEKEASGSAIAGASTNGTSAPTKPDLKGGATAASQAKI